MKPRPPNLPLLCVEGVDDVSAIAGLLKRHGYDTKQGQQHLYIKPLGSLDELLDALQDTIKAERGGACGFVLDIDVEVKHRWQAVVDRLKFTGDPTTKLSTPVDPTCPSNGFIGQVDGYPHPFGVWLMPDCASDHKKLEDLLATLIPDDHPLKDFAETSTLEAAKLVDNVNAALAVGAERWERFSAPDTIKAVVRTWLAWQREPGVAFGAAINSQVLRHDSVQARAFMDWLARLYGFNFWSATSEVVKSTPP
jgi:hypothetical protein